MPNRTLILQKPLGTRKHKPALLEAAATFAAVVILSLLAMPLAVSIWQSTGALMVLALLLSLGALVLRQLPVHYPHRHFGWCNAITLFRAAAVCWLAGLWHVADEVMTGSIAWSVSIAALALLVLDGVDGWLARKTGHTSDYGARFDMEVDALLALVLAILAWQSGKLDAWVLLLGLPRPGFILASKIWPKLAGDLPPSTTRKTICVIQIAVLATLLAPVVSPFGATILAGVTLALLTWSFGRDAYWLLRQ